MFLTARMQKMTMWLVTAAALQMTVTPAWADATGLPTGPASVADTTSEGYLQQIAQYTNATMTSVSNIPFYLLMITESMYAWLNPDQTDTTSSLQGAFTNYYNALTNSTNVQPMYLTSLTNDILSGASTNTLPNANDLSFETLLGTKFLNPDPRDSNSQTTDSSYNYIKNLSGGGLSHAMPSPNWNGTAADQAKYNTFYFTTTAAETYNAYVLTQLATDMITAVPANQAALTSMANGSSFFSNVASEAIGVVLRQILMFESQNFVVMTQMLKTEKQLLATQAVTNTLLMNNAVTSEQLLLRKAIVKTQAM